jgi:tetratricopeptide (TPR) repeat protein
MNDDLLEFDALWDYDRPVESEARFRELLPAAESWPDVRLQLLTQIARAQGLQRRFVEAQATLDEVEAALSPDMLRPRIRYMLERGRVFNSSGQPAQARTFFEAAWTMAEAHPAEALYAIDAAHMLAIVALPDAQLAWNLKALALAEGASDERSRRWRGSLYNNIGWTYHGRSDYVTALEYLERALAVRREQGDAEETRIARWCVARVRRDLGQVEEALAEQRSLLAEHERLGERSGYVFEEIGECLRLMGDQEAARPYFAEAYSELARDPWLVANESSRLERLRLLGQAASGG